MCRDRWKMLKALLVGCGGGENEKGGVGWGVDTLTLGTVGGIIC